MVIQGSKMNLLLLLLLLLLCENSICWGYVTIAGERFVRDVKPDASLCPICNFCDDHKNRYQMAMVNSFPTCQFCDNHTMVNSCPTCLFCENHRN